MAESCLVHYGHVRRYLDQRGLEFGIGLKPNGTRCATCHGPASADEVHAQMRWHYRLLQAVSATKGKTLTKMERERMRALSFSYGGSA